MILVGALVSLSCSIAFNGGTPSNITLYDRNNNISLHTVTDGAIYSYNDTETFFFTGLNLFTRDHVGSYYDITFSASFGAYGSGTGDITFNNFATFHFDIGLSSVAPYFYYLNGNLVSGILYDDTISGGINYYTFVSYSSYTGHSFYTEDIYYPLNSTSGVYRYPSIRIMTSDWSNRACNCSLGIRFPAVMGALSTDDYNTAWQDGYNSGWSVGQEVGYQEGYENSERYTEGYAEGFDVGHANGYSEGYAVGIHETGSFNFGSILKAVVDTPIYFLQSLFGWSLFGEGETLATIIITLITALVFVALLKKVF